MSTCRGGDILWRPPAQLVIKQIQRKPYNSTTGRLISFPVSCPPVYTANVIAVDRWSASVLLQTLQLSRLWNYTPVAPPYCVWGGRTINDTGKKIQSTSSRCGVVKKDELHNILLQAAVTSASLRELFSFVRWRLCWTFLQFSHQTEHAAHQSTACSSQMNERKCQRMKITHQQVRNRKGNSIVFSVEDEV